VLLLDFHCAHYHISQMQGIFHAEELDEIKATLKAPLPACFRINPNSHSAQL
jgi:hypothetical protein